MQKPSPKTIELLDALLGIKVSTLRALRAQKNRSRWYREAEYHYNRAMKLLGEGEVVAEVDELHGFIYSVLRGSNEEGLDGVVCFC